MINKNEKVLQWAKEYLDMQENSNIINIQQIVQTSYSTVYKIDTNQGNFYLKKTPKDLFLEPDTINFLSKNSCKNIPKLIARNDKLFCFLMTACGDISLRHLFNGQVDLEQLKQGVKNFTRIQRSLESSVTQMLSLGMPDWRFGSFTSLYHNLIKQEQLLKDDGMTIQEIAHLYEQKKVCANLCEQILEYDIPETINHCDFQENNMLLDNRTGDINIIDWGETVITHPFLSSCGFLWNMTYFQNVKLNDSQYKKLQLFCIDAWLDVYSKEKLLKILNIVNKLNGIFAALGYERMYKATSNQENNVQKGHNGAIAGCLRSFLSMHDDRNN